MAVLIIAASTPRISPLKPSALKICISPSIADLYACWVRWGEGEGRLGLMGESPLEIVLAATVSRTDE